MTKNASQSPALPTIICLLGPTASGKTQLAIELTQQFPCEIISVDSAMIYKGLDIGTAKPSKEELAKTPHRLIDILDPADAYSAGQFCKDAQQEIQTILDKRRIPLLVGGTMLYFRALQMGLSPLPPASKEIRQRLNTIAIEKGWDYLHHHLSTLDPIAAQRINPQDTQRIQRALEIHAITGLSMTEFCKQTAIKPAPYQMLTMALIPEDREYLHARIAMRFKQMLKAGFIEEVDALWARGDLHADLPALRAVGYRQAWDYLSGNSSKDEMELRSIIATRQLAKRQLTWLRSWPNSIEFKAEAQCLTAVLNYLRNKISL